MMSQLLAKLPFLRAVRAVLPGSSEVLKEGLSRGIWDGFCEVGRTFLSNFVNEKVIGRRVLINGLFPATANYLLSTNQTLGGDDFLPDHQALKRAVILGSMNFLGSMFLVAPGPGFRNWARQDLAYGLVLPLADVFGALSKKYLLENVENRESLAREVTSHVTIWGSAAYFVRYFFHKFREGNGAMNRGRAGLYSLILGLGMLCQSWWIAKKQSEHSGNPHLDIGRFAALQAGGLISTIIPISLMSEVPHSTTLFARDTMAANVSVTLRSLPFRGGAMTHFYAKLQDYNWLHAQLMNGIRILTLGLIFPTNQLYIHALIKKIGWLFFVGQALEIFFVTLYWNQLDQMTGGRLLAGKGQWKKGDVPKLLKKANQTSSSTVCDRLHDQMLENMGSFHPLKWQQMPDKVDFVHHETFLPNKTFTSLSDWFNDMTNAELSLYGGGLLSCQNRLKKRLENSHQDWLRSLAALLQPSYELIERRLDIN